MQHPCTKEWTMSLLPYRLFRIMLNFQMKKCTEMPLDTKYFAIGINRYLPQMAQVRMQKREIYELSWITDRIWVRNLYVSLRLRGMNTVSYCFVYLGAVSCSVTVCTCVRVRVCHSAKSSRSWKCHLEMDTFTGSDIKHYTLYPCAQRQNRFEWVLIDLQNLL